MKKGAHDYIAKPFNVEEFSHIVRQALAHRRLVHENIDLKRRIAEGGVTDDIVAHSEPMRKIVELARKVAPGTASVLLAGESGTGKEVVARFIHANSDRRNAPFVAVNCGAMPEALMESELFGHKKGAFTGATEDKPGLFKAADGGTLFLDEIGDLPAPLQVKLLRVLQERTLRPVGASREIPVNVRIVSASNRNLEEEVQAGRFRADLFYRLNVISITIPPLRTRPEDIPPLIARLLPVFASDNNRQVRGVSPEAMRHLMDYPFGGNVRELKNILERAVALSSGPLITPDDLPASVVSPQQNAAYPVFPDLAPGFHLDEEMKKFETHYIDTALTRTGGVQAAAAELLGISVRSLRYRLKKEDGEAKESCND
jgi:two-component system response regulator PilR (NtrC family)